MTGAQILFVVVMFVAIAVLAKVANRYQRQQPADDALPDFCIPTAHLDEPKIAEWSLNPVQWYRNWQQRRLDRKIIREALGFMSSWNEYNIKKAEEDPLPEHPFAARVEALKRREAKRIVDSERNRRHIARDSSAKADPYAFDQMLREMTGAPGSTVFANTGPLPVPDDVIIANAAKKLRNAEDYHLPPAFDKPAPEFGRFSGRK